ncbi:MAG: glycosyl hydrolase 115 family protein [Eubacterium sp.]|nr:glycosyl hydrolase 115 family protein [Eubacterium sp.]
MDFRLVKDKVASLVIDKNSEDYAGLLHSSKFLVEDVKLITDQDMEVKNSIENEHQIIMGTMGKSPIVDKFIEDGIVDVKAIENKRECFVVSLVEVEGMPKIVIVGTQTISTLYGMYYISRKIGISPWVYWGDVKPQKKTEILIDDRINHVSKEPSVKYRGFFMNDEWPSLGNFVMNTFGDFNEFFYEKVFDLLLRLKGNYFWPAMWSASLPLDGSEDPLAILKLATSLGITIGQSHHEPLTRASEEWDKVKSDTNNEGYGKDWNYYTNKEGLYRYWKDGMERDKDFSHMITIGMRGERDSMMLGEDSTVQENVELLREIITDQNKIIKETGCENMPKMLALYKEVERFYYGGDGVKGLQGWDALDDTILLLSDDNFANVRTLPTEELKNRPAGWGLYYHFDYHGGPISYEWINSTPLAKIWEQVTMAYEYGIRDLWIVNVGDIRPDELPLSYFMELAYDYEGMGATHPNETHIFLINWVEQQFGAHIKDEAVKRGIVEVLKEYVRINGLRRPEAMNPGVYSVTNFNETQKMIARCEALFNKVELLKKKIPEESRDAFFGLVYYPAAAGMNLQLMSLYSAMDAWYADESVAAANIYASKVEDAIALDKELEREYNEDMAGGKWKGMMLSKHACFENWNDEGWHYPEFKRVENVFKSKMLVRVEGAEHFIDAGEVVLPEFTEAGKEVRTIEIANAGHMAFDYVIDASEGIKLSSTSGKVQTDVVYVKVSIDRNKIKSDSINEVVVKTAGAEDIKVIVKYSTTPENIPEGTHIERDGIVSIEMEHYVKNKSFDGHRYEKLQEYGKTLSTMKVYPVVGNYDTPGEGPSLQYSIYVREAGEYDIKMITTPANNLEDGRNMRYAISVNDGDIQVAKTLPDSEEDYGIGGGVNSCEKCWGAGVLNNAHFAVTKHKFEAGVNKVTVYGMEAGLGLQKMIIYKDDLPESYLGPDESPMA